jgi:hypothetical protein
VAAVPVDLLLVPPHKKKNSLQDVGSEVLTVVAVKKSSTFWDISLPALRRNISPPSSGSKNKPSNFQETLAQYSMTFFVALIFSCMYSYAIRIQLKDKCKVVAMLN